VIDDEQIVLLNDDWQAIGTAPKLASHHANTPLHLAFSCYVFNSKGELLVTRRALSKKVWPGIWSNTCCGHPAPGEAMPAAIRRRLQHELGLSVSDLKVVLPKFRYCIELNGIVENECCPVYVAQATSDPVLNPEEVMAYKWLSWNKFKSETTKQPDVYSEWCRLQISPLETALPNLL
jgi:isopentenyl-diphosphate delta-isomerase